MDAIITGPPASGTWATSGGDVAGDAEITGTPTAGVWATTGGTVQADAEIAGVPSAHTWSHPGGVPRADAEVIGTPVSGVWVAPPGFVWHEYGSSATRTAAVNSGLGQGQGAGLVFHLVKVDPTVYRHGSLAGPTRVVESDP